MKFLLVKQQHGIGCDYTIGCGINFEFIEADTFEEAERLVIYPDGEDEYSSLEDDERKLKRAMLVPIEHVHDIDLESWSEKIQEKIKEEAEAKQRRKDEAELERLKKKLGKD